MIECLSRLKPSPALVQEGGRFYTKFSEKIYIQYKPSEYPDFQEKIEATLELIGKTEVGNRLLQKINQGKGKAWIQYDPNRDDTGYRSGAPLGDAVIRVTCKEGFVCGYAVQKIKNPLDAILFHELCHAYHYSYGNDARTSDKYKNRTDSIDLSIWGTLEEYHTIMGFLKKDHPRTKPKITENAYRLERGYIVRYSHLDLSNLSKEEKRKAGYIEKFAADRKRSIEWREMKKRYLERFWTKKT